jgi:hydroxyquinol 1,2-dioxygenase
LIIHFENSRRSHAPGYEQVITHVFVDGDPYLDGYAVFAVKNSLVGKCRKVDDAAPGKKRDLSNPFQKLEFDFRLSPAKKGTKARKNIATSDVVT